MTLEFIESALTMECQRITRTVLRKEAVHLDKPTRAMSDEIRELTGYLNGLKCALAIVASQRSQNELPLMGESK